MNMLIKGSNYFEGKMIIDLFGYFFAPCIPCLTGERHGKFSAAAFEFG